MTSTLGLDTIVQLGIDGTSFPGNLTLTAPSVYTVDTQLNVVGSLINTAPDGASLGSATILGIQAVVDPPSNSTSYLSAATIYSITKPTNTSNMSVLEGVFIEVRHNGHGNIADGLVGLDCEIFNYGAGNIGIAEGYPGMTAVYGQTNHGGAGSVENCAGVWAVSGNSGAGTVVYNSGLYVGSPTFIGRGVLTHNYGIFLEDQRGVSSDTWAIKSSGGNVYIGNGSLTLSNIAAPIVATGELGLGSTTSTSASAGTNGDVPSQVLGYIIANIGGVTVKLPYYAA
jgi:hypothetical protein